MVLFRPLSDLHNEVQPFTLNPLPTDKDTILSLAGDIYSPKKLMPWLHEVAERFKHVVVVLGNHDYWKGSYDRVRQEIELYIHTHEIKNVHVLFDRAVVLEGYLFFGGTMWTDFNRRDPMTMLRAPDVMKDYKKIRTNNYGRRLTVQFLLERHEWYKTRLRETLADPQYADLPIVVLSHHAPCYLSLDPCYSHNHNDNGYYYANMHDLILDNPRIRLWQHGHIHYRSYYDLGDTQILCNPSGYIKYGERVELFDPELVLDLDNLPKSL